MKSIISILIIFLTFQIYQLNTEDCLTVKEGNFKIKWEDKDGSKKSTIIERHGDIQIETYEEIGLKLKFKVKWLNDCSYQLIWLETLRDENNYNYPKNQIITVEIIDVKHKYYTQKSSSNLSDFVAESKVFVIENNKIQHKNKPH